MNTMADHGVDAAEIRIAASMGRRLRDWRPELSRQAVRNLLHREVDDKSAVHHVRLLNMSDGQEHFAAKPVAHVHDDPAQAPGGIVDQQVANGSTVAIVAQYRTPDDRRGIPQHVDLPPAANMP